MWFIWIMIYSHATSTLQEKLRYSIRPCTITSTTYLINYVYWLSENSNPYAPTWSIPPLLRLPIDELEDSFPCSFNVLNPPSFICLNTVLGITPWITNSLSTSFTHSWQLRVTRLKVPSLETFWHALSRWSIVTPRHTSSSADRNDVQLDNGNFGICRYCGSLKAHISLQLFWAWNKMPLIGVPSLFLPAVSSGTKSAQCVDASPNGGWANFKM